ncbi:MAG: 3'-5' exonuclease [Cytophagales bacterium]|nr:3'-5' exonuclease [Cytophagales bacterium]
MKIQFENIFRNFLIIDIETASNFEDYSDMDERMRALWDKKASFIQNQDDKNPNELYFDKGAIFAEFGKVICIAAGVFTKESDHSVGLRIKSFANNTEKETLEAFKALVEGKFDGKQLRLVAHNGKEFDFPYLCRRMLVNDIEIPDSLDIREKKPWEINHIDTMELWKFGDRKNFTSLELLAALFGIESSKDDIDGSRVNEVYYKENDLGRISKYCQRDVMVTAQVFLRLHGFQKIEEDRINYL